MPRGVRLFGIPVTIGGDALVISLIFMTFAYSRSAGIEPILLFAAAVVPVVLVHELGHAFEARRAGGSPLIKIGILGGETSGIPTEASHWRQVWIAGAGIAYSLVFLGLVWLATRALGISLTETAGGRWLGLLITINGWWAVIQLLPFGSFDGTAILEHTLGGLGVRRRDPIILGVTVVLGVGVVGGLLAFSAVIPAMYGAYLTWRGISGRLERMRWSSDRAHGWEAEVQALADAGDSASVAVRTGEIRRQARSVPYRQWAAHRRVAALAATGSWSEVTTTLDREGATLDPEMVARLWVAAGRPARALESLRSRGNAVSVQTLRNDPELLGLVVQTLIETGDRGDLWKRAQEAGWDALPAALAVELITSAFAAGAYDVAAALRSRAAGAEPGASALDAAALALLAGQSHATEALTDAIRSAPSARDLRVSMLALAASGRAEALAAAVAGAALSKEEVAAAQVALHRAGAYEDAVQTGEEALRRAGSGAPDGTIAYNLACSLARLGRKDEALAHLRNADIGLLAKAPADGDFASLAGDPRFARVTGTA